MEKTWNYCLSIFYVENHSNGGKINYSRIDRFKFKNLQGLISEFHEILTEKYNNASENIGYSLSHVELRDGKDVVFRIFGSLGEHYPEFFLGFTSPEIRQKFIKESKIDFSSMLEIDPKTKGYKIAALFPNAGFTFSDKLDNSLKNYPYKKMGFKSLVCLERAIDTGKKNETNIEVLIENNFYHYRILRNAISHILSIPFTMMDFRIQQPEGYVDRAVVVDPHGGELLSISIDRDRYSVEQKDVTLHIYPDYFKWSEKELDISNLSPIELLENAYCLKMAEYINDKWIYKFTEDYEKFIANNNGILNPGLYKSRQYGIRFEGSSLDGGIQGYVFCTLYESLSESLHFYSKLPILNMFLDQKEGRVDYFLNKLVLYSAISGNELIKVEPNYSRGKSSMIGVKITLDHLELPQKYILENYKNLKKSTFDKGKYTCTLNFKNDNNRGRDFNKGIH